MEYEYKLDDNIITLILIFMLVASLITNFILLIILTIEPKNIKYEHHQHSYCQYINNNNILINGTLIFNRYKNDGKTLTSVYCVYPDGTSKILNIK